MPGHSSIVLADFARLDAKPKRVVVHDGTGHSFWLAPNGEKEKLAAAKIDWVFMVWQPASWERLRKLPADLNPTEPADTSPPAQIDVYTAGIDWADVTVPAGLEVVDQRLVAHGFTAADGVVLEGKVTDLSTRQPIAATIKLQRVEPQDEGRLPLPGRRRGEGGRSGPLGAEEGAGRLDPRGRRGGRLRVAVHRCSISCCVLCV